MGGSGKTEVSRYLAEQLPGSPLVISKNIAGSQDEINFLRSKDIKVSSFKNIQSKEIKIFDDSLHSKKKKEGLNILCARADLPIGNGYLAPFGPLRINKFLPKIDLIWFTHCGTKTPTWSTKNHGERSIYSRYIFCEKSMEKLNQIPKHSRVGVFTGIADPQRFCNLILSFRSDLKIFLVPFPDHFRFQKSDWDFIQKVAQEDKIPHWLCTQKDFFRLQRDPIPTELMKTSFALELKLELDLQSQKVFEEFFR